MNTTITPNPTSTDRLTLYYHEGSSDKVYQCAIEPAGSRFVVNFAYGRRGSTLNTGTKTNVPVDYGTAKRTFEKLVKEKKAKGYTEGEEGTPYQHSDQQSSGIHCQLLNPIDEFAVPAFLHDTAYCAQEKFDGRRLLLQKQGAAIHGINRKGLLCGCPSPLIPAAQNIPGDFILDGEAVGDNLHAFDLLVLNGEDLRPLSYRQRYLCLMNLLFAGQQQFIRLVPYLSTSKEKAAFVQEMQELKREGVVFKRLDAPYTPGRPNSGGSQFKHKFYATVSAVVAKVNSQRSVELKLLNSEGWVTAGNVTIPANQEVPTVGSVVEVRYLYAFKESGSLYQPTYLGLRHDVSQIECKTTQLKFKASDTDEEP